MSFKAVLPDLLLPMRAFAEQTGDSGMHGFRAYALHLQNRQVIYASMGSRLCMHLQNRQLLHAMPAFRMMPHAAQTATTMWSSMIRFIVIAFIIDQSTALRGNCTSQKTISRHDGRKV